MEIPEQPSESSPSLFLHQQLFLNQAPQFGDLFIQRGNDMGRGEPVPKLGCQTATTLEMNGGGVLLPAVPSCLTGKKALVFFFFFNQTPAGEGHQIQRQGDDTEAAACSWCLES